MYYKSLNEIAEAVKSAKSNKKVAVAAAEDEHVLNAVMYAKKEGGINPILVGNKNKIKDLLAHMSGSVDDQDIFDSNSVEESAALAVKLIKDQKADFIMKGMLHTSTLFKAILNKEMGLCDSGLITHFTLMELPKYHKLVAFSDIGLVISPTLQQKKVIIENAVRTLRSMGIDKPKVAVLTAVEEVNPKMPETVDAKELKEMSMRGEILDCIIEGPVSFDIAANKEKAKIKGFSSEVVGDVDLYIVPSVVTGNVLVKALKEYAGAKTVGLAVGAKVPIIVSSRATSENEKYLSIMTCAAMETNTLN